MLNDSDVATICIVMAGTVKISAIFRVELEGESITMKSPTPDMCQMQSKSTNPKLIKTNPPQFA